jgi:signal transduction histidine kinase
MNARVRNTGGAVTVRPSDRHVPKIRRTLTVAYAASLLVVLLLAGGVLRWVVRDALDREFERSMQASAAMVRQFFRVELAEYRSTEATLAHIAGELVFEDRTMHMRRPDGSEFELIAVPKPHTHQLLAAPVRRMLIPLDEGLAPGWKIDVEASAATVEAVKHQLDRWFALGIPFLFVLASIAGWWLTGRTLRPVRQMADAASEIAPGSGGRIPIDNPSDELGRLGTRFNALLDRLEIALVQQRRFLADAAHELRTPLARARGRLEIAMMPLAGTAPEGTGGVSGEHTHGDTQALAAAHNELVRMSTLVDELLQLARADGDHDVIATQPLYLDDIVSGELGRWMTDAQSKDITLTCSELHEAPVQGDAVLLGRLLGILVDNALRYTDPQGRVDIRVGHQGAQVVLHVEDNGMGITPDEHARLFERFFRGDRARARQNDGSGLGLAIAQWICQQHGGTITVQNGADNTGTCVTVSLPRDATRDATRDETCEVIRDVSRAH